MAPRILFCSDPFDRRRPDESFAGEHEAALAAGFSVSFVDHDAVVGGEARRALGRLVESSVNGSGDTVGALIYRGWMLKPPAYEGLYVALRERGDRPITTPEAYAQAHHLPLAYPLIEAETAASVWIEGTDLDSAHEAALSLGPGALMIKDFVKSAKHRFREACYIEDAADRARFDEICLALIEDRGALFERGLVFRRYLPLREQGRNMLGAPIHEEYRMFFFDGRLLELGALPEGLPIGRYAGVAARFASRFITIDAARAEDGGWFIVETGDGGVSGIPPAAEDRRFYEALFAASQGG
jgi:hypothetical protein